MQDLILFALLLANLVIIGWLVFLTFKYREIIKKAGIIFTDKDTSSLGEKIKEYAKEVKTVEDHCFEIDKQLKKVKKTAEMGLHKKGFVRYNPFGDVGGNQSFSLCLLDEDGTGYVISSIHSREGTRVYSKTVDNGKSEYNLSDEEKKAIEIALG